MPKHDDFLSAFLQHYTARIVDLAALASFAWLNWLLATNPSLISVTVPLLVGAITWIIVSSATNLYSTSGKKTPATACAAAMTTSWATAYSIAVTAHLVDGKIPWETDPLLLLGLLATISTVNQYFLVLPKVKSFDPDTNIFIAGCNPDGLRLWDAITKISGSPRTIKGFLHFPSEAANTSLPAKCPVIGQTSSIHHLLNDHPIDKIYIAKHDHDSTTEVADLLLKCDEVGIPFALPRETHNFEHSSALQNPKDAQGLPFTHFTSTRRSDSYLELKRLIDIAVSTAAIIISLPLMSIVALLIRIESDGPVFFRQIRVGQHGRTFALLKFRSMFVNAEQQLKTLTQMNEMDGPVFKIRHDPRITRVGRWIRRLSIDELPQFLNVLRGEMSLVGPRPPLPSEVAQYEPWQRRRLSVKPGITCYWQVGGRNNISFREWMSLDLKYIDRASLWLDIELLFKTFPAVLSGRGAS